MDAAEAVAESYGHPRVAGLVPELAAYVKEAFSGTGGATRGEFLRSLQSPEMIQAWRGVIESTAELAPDATRGELVEAISREDAEHRALIADAAGLTALDRSSGAFFDVNHLAISS